MNPILKSIIIYTIIPGIFLSIIFYFVGFYNGKNWYLKQVRKSQAKEVVKNIFHKVGLKY